MSEIRVDSIGNESNTGGPVLSGITTFSGQQYFVPPKVEPRRRDHPIARLVPFVLIPTLHT